MTTRRNHLCVIFRISPKPTVPDCEINSAQEELSFFKQHQQDEFVPSNSQAVLGILNVKPLYI